MAFVVVGHAITAGYGTDVPLRGQVATDPGFYVPLRVATNPLLSVAYSFHVPLFAFVSGYVLWHEVPRPVWTEIRKRAVGLLIPYFGWFLIVDGLSRYLRPHAREPFLKQLGSIVINPNNHHALWERQCEHGLLDKLPLVVHLRKRLGAAPHPRQPFGHFFERPEPAAVAFDPGIRQVGCHPV